MVQDIDFTYTVDIDPPAEASTPPKNQQNNEPVNAESLDVGIPSYTEFYGPLGQNHPDVTDQIDLQAERDKASQRAIDSLGSDPRLKVDPNSLSERKRHELDPKTDYIEDLGARPLPLDFGTEPAAPEYFSAPYASNSEGDIGEALWNIYRLFFGGTSPNYRIHDIYGETRDVYPEPDSGVMADQAIAIITSVGYFAKTFAIKVTPIGYTRGFRAVSEAEYQDILKTGKLRGGSRNGLEGKWFSESLEGATKHGNELHKGEPYRIIEAFLPDDAPSLHLDPNIDGHGPSRYIGPEDLDDIIILP